MNGFRGLIAGVSAFLALLPAPAPSQTVPVVLVAPAPVNSVAFAVRPALPGHLLYLQAIRYIDDGMKYTDPYSGFFVSPAGQICFRTFPSTPRAIYDSHYSDWCMYPQHVGRIDAMANKITNIDEVRLWCVRSYPQCVRRVGYPNPLGDRRWIANSVSAPTVDYRQQRAALQNLIYLMGGNVVDVLP